MSSYENVDELLAQFDEIQALAAKKMKKVNRFLSKLREELNYNYQYERFLKNCKFIVVGSVAEGTAVSDTFDFDVIMELRQPFTMDYFEVVNVSKNGVYKLQRRNGEEDESISAILNEYTNKKGYLIVKNLKEDIFYALEHAVQKIDRDEPNGSYMGKRKHSSFCITSESTNTSNFKIDLVPQIKGSQEYFSQDWSYDVPYVVDDYLLGYAVHAHFNLEFPFWLDEENYEHLAVYATFSKLEGYCMNVSDNVRNAVRLTKAISKHYKWAKEGLQSFHIKRIAISLFESLEDVDPWDGCKAILSELEEQLYDDAIWGVFLNDHNIALKDTNTCVQLANEINWAKGKIRPSNILEKLSE